MQHTLDLAFVGIWLNIIFTKFFCYLLCEQTWQLHLAFQTLTWLLRNSVMHEIIKNNINFLFTFEYATAFIIFNILWAGYISAFALILLDYI